MTASVGDRGWTSLQSLTPAGRLAVLVLGTGAVVASGAWVPVTWRAIGLAVALGTMAWAALIDLTERRLPNELALLAAGTVAATAVAVTIAQGFDVGSDVAVSAVAGAALFGGPMLVLHLLSPGGMGFGDVKAGVVLGGAIGLIDAWSCLVGLFVGSALTALLGVVGRRRAVAFGPGLVAGAEVALVVARLRGLSPVN
ncbi:MAG: prepilin peptidase [Ilumatobacteraceae bacterium]